MDIFSWTAVVLAFFSAQYSYDANHAIIDESHIKVHNGTLVTCVYPSDKSFKKGSPTLARSELRLLKEYEDGLYEAGVELLEYPLGDEQFSLWQLFGKGPLVMIRQRIGQKQLVVFDGEPKIQVVSEFPERCIIKCGREGFVRCGVYSSIGNIKCGGKLHMKVGIYAQGEDPKSAMCSKYGAIFFRVYNDTRSGCDGPRV